MSSELLDMSMNHDCVLVCLWSLFRILVWYYLNVESIIWLHFIAWNTPIYSIWKILKLAYALGKFSCFLRYFPCVLRKIDLLNRKCFNHIPTVYFGSKSVEICSNHPENSTNITFKTRMTIFCFPTLPNIHKCVYNSIKATLPLHNKIIECQPLSKSVVYKMHTIPMEKPSAYIQNVI